MNDPVLLDTSAIFAFLEDEQGADMVRGYIDAATRGERRLLLSFATLTELRYVIMQEQNTPAADRAVALVKAWPVVWVQSDEPLCLKAAEFKARHHLSFADTFVAATAQRHSAGLVHKDPEFEVLADEILLLPLPYK